MNSVLTLKPVSEIPWSYPSNESSKAVFSNGAIYFFSVKYKMEFGISSVLIYL